MAQLAKQSADETAQLARSVASAFESACIAELEALKPGNVHIFADGHGMQVQDFVHSAEAAAGQIAIPGLNVGERVLRAVEATWDAVGCNTNLGIVLLDAPLVHAALNRQHEALREDVMSVLEALTVADAEQVFRAIVRAAPAGLGNSPRHDVFQPPTVTLLEAMCEAQERDLVARQYATAFADIFDFGVPRYNECLQRWGRPAWAVSAVYLGFLARYGDSHVARKHGRHAEDELRAEAAKYEAALLASENPKAQQHALLDFDRSLKARGLNPGTCADLTVASLLVVLLEKLCNHGTHIRAMALT